MEIANNTISRCNGEFRTEGTPLAGIITIHGNTFSDCSCESGLIHTQNAVKFDISENGFRNCSSLSGIVNIESTTLTAKYDIDIKKNSFIGTTDASIHVAHFETPVTLVLYQNIFENPKAVVDVRIEGVSKGTVNAKYNYWGQEDWHKVYARVKAPANIAVIQSPYFITDNVNDFNKDNIGNGPNPVESSSTPGNTGLTPGKIVGIVVAAVIAFTIIVALITIGIVYAKKPLYWRSESFMQRNHCTIPSLSEMSLLYSLAMNCPSRSRL